MLRLTDTAIKLIEDLVLEADLPDGGLRIGQPVERLGLRMELVPAPCDADDVLRRRGASVFLDPAAAARLDDQILDARRDPGSSAFFLDA